MSDQASEPSRRYDGAWAQAVARSRGSELQPEQTARLAATVGPVLERFAELSRELETDDDMYEFRRLLAAEAPHP